MKACKLCKTDISHRKGMTIYCLGCSKNINKENQKIRNAQRLKTERLCIECGTNIGVTLKKLCKICVTIRKKNSANKEAVKRATLKNNLSFFYNDD